MQYLRSPDDLVHLVVLFKDAAEIIHEFLKALRQDAGLENIRKGRFDIPGTCSVLGRSPLRSTPCAFRFFNQ